MTFDINAVMGGTLTLKWKVQKHASRSSKWLVKNSLLSQHTLITHLLITYEFVQLIMVSFCSFLLLQLFLCSSVSFSHTTFPSGISICYATDSLWAAGWTSAPPRTIPPYLLWHFCCFSLCSFLRSQSVILWLFCCFLHLL